MAEPQLNPQEQEEALTGVSEMLSNELLQISSTKQQATAAATDLMAAEALPQQINSSLSQAYVDAAMQPGEYELTRLQPGAKVIRSWGNTRQLQAPNGETVVFARPPEVNPFPSSSYQTARNMMENAEKPKSSLNVEAELSRIYGLRGDEKAQAAAQLSVSIQKALSDEHRKIQEDAAGRSGLIEAQSSFDLNMMLDQQKGGKFATQASHQTIQAQAVLDAASRRADDYTKQAISRSSRIAELSAHLNNVMFIQKNVAEREARAEQTAVVREGQNAEIRARQEAQFEHNRQQAEARGPRELALFIAKREWDLANGLLEKNTASDRQAANFAEKERIRQEKEAILRSTVSDQQLWNYRYAYGKNEGDIQDRTNIVLGRSKDKELQQILLADSSSIREMLFGNDASLRQRALRVVKGYDAALAAGTDLPPDQIDRLPDSPVTAFIRQLTGASSSAEGSLKFAKDSKLFLTGTDPQLLKDRGDELLRTTDKASKERLRQNLIDESFDRFLNKHMRDRMKEDVRTWKASEMTGIFKTVLDDTQSMNPQGKIDFDSFINAVTTKELKTPEGKVLTHDEKIALVRNTIQASTANAPKTMLYPGTDYLASQLSAEAGVLMQLSWVQKVLGLLPGRGNPMLQNALESPFIVR